MIPFLLLVSCSSGAGGGAATSTVTGETWVRPDPPANGVQIVVDDIAVEPYSETEMCRYLLAPNEVDGRIVRMELYARPGLHHAFVSKLPVAQEAGETPCFGIPDELMEGGILPEPLFASSTQVDSEVVDFPEGIAVDFGAGQPLVVDYHYLNVWEEPIEGEIVLNLVFAEEDEETQPAQLYVMGNISGIDIPAGGSQTLTTTCAFDEDVSVFSLTPHMHGLGRSFSAWLAATGESLLVDEGWYNPSTTYLDPPLQLAAGDGITFQCSWDNPRDEDVAFGPTSDDEMCFLFGYHYPAESWAFMVEDFGCEQEG